MNNDTCVVQLKDVWAGYKVLTGFKSVLRKYRVVLKGINLRVQSGERVAIIGESGSGKTTLLRVILGINEPIKGEVYVLGAPIYKLPWGKRIQVIRKIGYVPQDPYKALNPALKVRQLLAEPLEAIKLNKSTIEYKIKETIRLVGLPSYVLDSTPDELSGGMRQRVLIARALIHEPVVLLLDEPTSALDVSMQAQIVNLLNEIYTQLKLTLILVTHDLSIAQYLADRVLIIRDGAIIEEGRLEEVLKSPREEFTRNLIKGYYFAACLDRS